VDYKGVGVQFTKMMPVAGLLTGAIVWGLIWYPYRVLEHAGVSGALAATLTYAGAFVLAAVLLSRRHIRPHLSWLLAAIGTSAGWANVGFTLAVIYGDVMRVVLLFYLAPVWTVLFARLLLGERLTAPGYGLMLLAITGALVMLWQPQLGWPLPRSMAEWIALSAGVMFALSNVLVRKTAGIAIELKVLAVFGGCSAASAACMLFGGPAPAAWAQVLDQAVLLVLLSVVILSVNVAVQYGLTRISANRAIVIYLFELVVTAISAWLLADELLTLKEWCGGAMIIVAGLLSDRLGTLPEAKPAASACSFAPAAHPD
jgi:drug/metabolite transporter (DMT)-like permease